MRRTKVWGLAVMAAGLPAMLILAQVAQSKWQAGVQAGHVALAVVFACLGANLFAVGLILLLTGLQERALSDRRVRAGAWTKLIGVNLLIPAFVFAVLVDDGSLEQELTNPWFACVAIVVFLVVARAGMLSLRRGWKHDARTAADTLRDDPRKHVLYLRSFRDDAELVLAPSRSLLARIFAAAHYTVAVSPEQELATIMGRIGPVIAIGRPGEHLPELGAARMYVGHDVWQEKVAELTQDARLVVIRGGDSGGLWWEVEHVLESVPADRVLFLSLGAPARIQGFDAELDRRIGNPIRMPLAEHRLTALFLRFINFGRPIAMEIGRVVYFDGKGGPIEVPIHFRLTLTGLVMSPYRPYRDTLVMTLEPVFHALGLPWHRRRNQTTAVLLALFVGFVGAHHYYLGQTRRGIWYSVAALTGVPMVLALCDAVRLALIDARTFDERYGATDCALAPSPDPAFTTAATHGAP